MDYTKHASYKESHTGTSVTIEFQCKLTGVDPRISSCGISHLYILID